MLDIVTTENSRLDGAVAERSLLIVDDDKPSSTRLARAMETRGFEVETAESVGEGWSHPARPAAPSPWSTCGSATATASTWSRPSAISAPDARAVVLTGYGNIATAVTAVKLGAVDYLAKPADADDVYRRADCAPPTSEAPPPENPMSADRVRWEHIQRVYELCNRNVSETARRLNMHRRTLQRILAKRAPR